MSGANAILEGKLGYDQFARVATITYPTPAGVAPFVITQDYDPYGHVLNVHDDVTNYWHLQDVDNAGRFRQEKLGNALLTERSYYADKQSLKSIVTAGGAVQSLAYEYDARSSVKSRTDTLQMQNKTERFRYDALDRLTCAYLYPLHDPRIDLMIWAEQTGVHGRHDGGVVGACIGMACERKELDGLL